MKGYSFIILLFFLPNFLISDEVDHQFGMANQYYRNGEFEKAMTIYEEIYNSGFEHPALYYNLGNACFKLKKIPFAILWYERARKIAPMDEDILYNLRLANVRVIDKIEPLPKLFFVTWWEGLRSVFSSDQWAIFLIALLWCTAVVSGVFFLVKSLGLQRIIFFLVAVLLLLIVISSMAMVQQLKIETDEKSAIVFSASVSVKSSPDSQSTDLFILHEGVKVEIEDQVGEWKKIRLADGKVGWLESKHLKII